MGPMSRRPSLPEPTDVVSGRARVNVEQLFALIHAVNPTDKGLNARAQAESYALKSRLQSLLIRQHAEVLRVEPHPTDERVVSLVHRIAGRDACHAVVPSLEDDARRWVQTQLGRDGIPTPAAGLPTGSNSTTARTPGPKKIDLQDPMSAGHAALEAFDYDEARRLYSVALARSGGGVAPALALLDLLVNHLADDEAAVELASELSSVSLADPTVLGCLSLAAARRGEVARARRWLKGAEAASAAETLVLLVEHALRAKRVDDAKSAIAALQDLDPANGALLRLRDGVGRLVADERAPEEAKLAAALSAEDWAQVGSLAAGLLARWPDNAPARAAQRVLDQRRAVAGARELVARAWRAWERGDSTALLSTVRQARALVVDDPATTAWLDEAEEVAKEQVEAAAIASARAAFTEGRLAEGLAVWAGLPTAARQAIRAAADVPEMGWFDEMGPGDGRIDAAIAVGRARELFARGEAEAASRLLDPHLPRVRETGDGRRLLLHIAEHLAAKAMGLERDAERAIVGALAAADHDRAIELLAALPVAARRQRRAEIEADRQSRARASARDAALASGDLLQARALAELHGDRPAVIELTQRLRAEWQVRVWDGVDIGLVDITLHPDPPAVNAWLIEDDDAFVHAQVLDGWVFLRVVALPELTTRRVITLRAPSAMRPHHVVVEKGVVTIVDSWGALLAIRLADGDVVRWLPRPPGVREPDTLCEGCTLAPGGRYVWMTFHHGTGPELRIYDTQSWPTYRLVREAAYGVPLLGCDEPEMARIESGKGTQLMTPRGDLIGRRKVLGDEIMTRVSVHPEGFPMCALIDASHKRAGVVASVVPELQAHVPADPMALLWPHRDRRNCTAHAFPFSSKTQPHQLATSRDLACVYAKVGPGGFSRIHTFIESDCPAQVEETSVTVIVAPATQLLVDVDARRVRAIMPTETGLEHVPLDGSYPVREPVDVGLAAFRAGWPEAGLDFELGCGYTGSTLNGTGETLVRILRGMDAGEHDAWIATFKRSEGDNAGSLFDLGSALAVIDRREDALLLMHSTGERFPDHPRGRLLRACALACSGTWDGVLSLLDGVDAGVLEPRHGQHLLHLRGVARLRTGDVEGAAIDIRRASELQGGCVLAGPLRLIELLQGRAVPDEVTTSEDLLLFRLGPLLAAIRTADEHLSGGRGPEVVQALDVPVVWRSRDRQALARLAEGWLLVEPTDDHHELRRRLALATFCGVQADYLEGSGHDVPIPPHTWSEGRLADVAARARVELERRA